MLINEIEPINNATIDLNDDCKIDEIIELPLRKACKIFKQKGIETVMSSANKNNILESNEKSIEKEDVCNINNNYNFLSAGKGYAWIMINFNTLSTLNKNILFNLEKISEKLVWFVHPFKMNGNIEFDLKIGKYSYDYLNLFLSDEEIPKNIEIDESLIEFEKRCIILFYPWAESSTEVVILRMPINNTTTLEEVEQYFVELANIFKSQQIITKTYNKR